jgi:hypothetical protein
MFAGNFDVPNDPEEEQDLEKAKLPIWAIDAVHNHQTPRRAIKDSSMYTIDYRRLLLYRWDDVGYKT